jgi:hypothetical protein
VGDRFTGEDLAGTSQGTETGCEIERSAAVATLDGNRLARIQADADGKGHIRVLQRMLGVAHLEINRGTERLTGRVESGQRLVAT